MSMMQEKMYMDVDDVCEFLEFQKLMHIVLMGFWIFMLIMDLLLPFTMIGFGRYFTAQYSVHDT